MLLDSLDRCFSADVYCIYHLKSPINSYQFDLLTLIKRFDIFFSKEFMMVLTSHQSSVGGVLEFGSQLINEGIVSGKEEREIREQMTLLSDRWENLRVGAMERQTK